MNFTIRNLSYILTELDKNLVRKNDFTIEKVREKKKLAQLAPQGTYIYYQVKGPSNHPRGACRVVFDERG